MHLWEHNFDLNMSAFDRNKMAYLFCKNKKVTWISEKWHAKIKLLKRFIGCSKNVQNIFWSGNLSQSYPPTIFLGFVDERWKDYILNFSFSCFTFFFPFHSVRQIKHTKNIPFFRFCTFGLFKTINICWENKFREKKQRPFGSMTSKMTAHLRTNWK